VSSLAARVAHWAGVRRAQVRLHVGATSVRAEMVVGDAVTWAAEARYAAGTELADAIARLAGELPRPCRSMFVTLEPPVVQRRTIPDLPPVRGAVLPALIAGQDRRFFRRNGEPLVTDAAWVRGNGTRVAYAAAVEHSVVEAIATGARAAGLRVADVTLADDPGGLSLLPPTEREGRARTWRRRVRRLATATAATWVVAGALYALRVNWEDRQIDAGLTAAEAPLAALRTARAELRSAEAAVVALRAADVERGRALGALGAIAGALPDSAVMLSLVWTRDGSGSIDGIAKRAADVVTALQDVEAAADARLEGRIQRESVAGRDWERFTILFGRPLGLIRGND